jgi:hypothetical protein
MKNLTLIFFAVICCCNYSCKKKADPVLVKQDTTKPIDTIVKPDPRYKYEGIYQLYISQYKADDYSGYWFAHIDTSYWCTVKAQYTPTDSVTYDLNMSTGHWTKYPALVLRSVDDSTILYKIGLDTLGEIYYYRQYPGYSRGGFIGTDSMYWNAGFQANHSSSRDTVYGHRIP